MPFRSISTNRPGFWRNATVVLAAGVALALPQPAEAFVILPDTAVEDGSPSAAVDPVVDLAADPAGYDLYLDISINGLSCDKVVQVHQEADGSLAVMPEDLAAVGLRAPPAGAVLPDRRIALNRLPDVTYVFNSEQQSIDFTAPDSARNRLIIDARRDQQASTGDRDEDAPKPPRGQASDFGAMLNYDLYESATRSDESVVNVAPLSGNFEARAFGPFGLIEQTFSVLSAPFEAHRLDTTWSYSDPAAVRTYRAGDVVTGALGWTRPTRLGGIQVQSDFGLRSDIVTYPVPSLSGSAALPSSVDIYVDNSNRYSGSVPAGPFDIVDVPVITGAGTVKLVLTDASGRQVVTSADYFASPSLVKPGLVDYSAELGFARTNYGSDKDGYDRRLMGSASIRTGASDWLTWEGHAEGGVDLVNAGSGLVAALGRLGLGEFSLAGSATRDGTAGMQLTGSLQTTFYNVSLGARVQRSFGHYEDIASFTAPNRTTKSANPATIYQLSLSLPTPFQGGRANLSYTQFDPDGGQQAQIVAASYSQRMFSGSASASAYMDMKSRDYGVTLNLSMPLGGGMSGGASVQRSSHGTSLFADVGGGNGNSVGDVAWQVQVDQEDHTDFAASARTTLPAAKIRARAAHSSGQTGISGELSGAVAVADGGLFFAAPVHDAFAVVDVGAANVPVLFRNNLVGFTGKNGKMLVPGLASYQKNRISIDPAKLPLDSVVEDTTATIIPARGSGTVVSFGKHLAGGNALVTFRDMKGDVLPLASSGNTGHDTDDFIVGYDGQALLEALGPHNSVTISLPDGSSCRADFDYAARGGDLVDIPDVVCRPQS